MRHTCTTGVTQNTQPQQILVSKAASWRSSAERRTASERTHANILGWSLRIYCCLNVPQETPVSAHLEQYFHPWPWEWSDTLLCSRKKSSLCPALESRGSGDPRKLKCISTGDLGRCPTAQCRTTSRAEQRPDPHRGKHFVRYSHRLREFPQVPRDPSPGCRVSGRKFGNLYIMGRNGNFEKWL